MSLNYNPRHGYGSGRVGKNDFSIDGKSWSYRDPDNAKDVDYSGGKGSAMRGATINEDADEMTNPLYDYSYGTVRDAAQTLGISNVNSNKEVRQIIKQIQEPKASSDKGGKEKEYKPVIPYDKSPSPGKIDLRQNTADAAAIIDNYNQGSITDNNLTRDSIDRFAGIGSDDAGGEFLANYSLNLRNTMGDLGIATRGSASGSTTVQPDTTSAPAPQVNPTSDEFTDQYKAGIKSNLVKV